VVVVYGYTMGGAKRSLEPRWGVGKWSGGVVSEMECRSIGVLWDGSGQKWTEGMPQSDRGFSGGAEPDTRGACAPRGCNGRSGTNVESVPRRWASADLCGKNHGLLRESSGKFTKVRTDQARKSAMLRIVTGKALFLEAGDF
jgi:hypothetical protein